MDEVAEVKSRLEITEVVGAYLPLKQAGRNLKASCPFHQEKSASFMVSPEKGIYHCFGCGEGGDIFSFVMKMEGLDFRQALEMLARKAGVELKERRGEDVAVKRLRGRLMDAHELAVKYFQASLVQNQRALDYVVKKRKLTKQTVKDFGIGYAPDSWEALTGWLLKKGFTVQELLQAGLAGQKAGRNTIYDLFRGRVMFPIGDREGQPIAFTGRVLDDGEPKYLNTPQTPLYDKSHAIFGWHLAREAVRTNDEVVLVEGQMDVVASHQAGVAQVVAASGTALTLEHLRGLSKLTKNVKLAFDSDRAGLAATERAIELGQKLGLTLRMVELPEGVKDADELVQQDVEAWRQAIASAKYIVDYLFDRYEKDFDLTSAVGKRGYADRVAASIKRLGDPVEQDHYVRLLADKTGTSEEAVRAKLAQAEERGLSAPNNVSSRQRTRPVSSGRPVSEPALARSEALSSAATRESTADDQPTRRAVVQAQGKRGIRQVLEESLLGLTLMHPSARVSLADLAAEQFSTPGRQAVFEALRTAPEASGDELARGLDEHTVYAQELLLIGEDEFADVNEEQLGFEAFTLAHKVQQMANAERKKRLSQQIQEAETRQDRAEVDRLMGEFQEIIRAEL